MRALLASMTSTMLAFAPARANAATKTVAVVSSAEPEPGPTKAISGETPRDTRVQPRFTGTALLVSAGLAGALGISANIARAVLLQTTCVPTDDSTEEVLNTFYGCVTRSGAAIVGMSALAVASNASATVLATGGGALRGRYDAARATSTTRNTPALMGLGGTVFGLGVVTAVAIRAVYWTGTVCRDIECMNDSISGYVAGVQIGGSLMGIGAGVFAYGAAYHNNVPRSFARLHMRPIIDPSRGMLGLSGRF